MKLRVFGILAALALLTATPALAQGTTAGVKVGINFSDVSQDPEESGCCDKKTGFIGGLFTTFSFNETLALQPEFLFTMRGAKFSEDDLEDVSAKLDYFEIPVFLRADFSSSPNRAFVLFGPTFAFNTKAKFSFEGESEDFKDDVETLDIGFAIAGGFQFGPGSVEIRYTHSFSDALKADDEEARHRVISILGGFRF
jgi:hypothetical protein